jgi:flavodoxin
MKTLVIFDSAYGNTEKIARSIGEAIGGDISVLKVNEVGPSDFESAEFILIGSPTYGGRPSPGIQQLLKIVPLNSIKGKKAAAFDTRFASKLGKIFGFAADNIAKDLKSKGAVLLGSEGFVIKNKMGPLTEGETERAAGWARELMKTLDPGK